MRTGPQGSCLTGFALVCNCILTSNLVIVFALGWHISDMQISEGRFKQECCNSVSSRIKTSYTCHLKTSSRKMISCHVIFYTHHSLTGVGIESNVNLFHTV